MLLTLMMNLNMFGGDVPPTPPLPVPMYDSGGGGGGYDGRDHKKEIEELRHKELLKDDEDMMDIIRVYLMYKN